MALFVLVFCAPLTLYGAMFWEHRHARRSAFVCRSCVLSAAPPAGLGGAVALRLVSGLAVWLRPEALMMDFLYALAIIVLYYRDRKKVNIAFLAGLSFVVLTFFVFNKN